MPDSTAIDQALIDTLLADPALMALVPDGVFYAEAGPSLVTGGNATRFVIVSLVEAVDVPTFGGRAYEDALFHVEACMLSTVADAAASIQAAAARIAALLEDQPLTVPGYAWMTTHRESRIRLTEVDDADPSIRWYRLGGTYRLLMSPA